MEEEVGDRTLIDDAGGPQVVAIIANPAKAAIVEGLKTTVEKIYVSSWNGFLKQIENNERSARLKRLAKEQRLEKKADDVAELLNAEGNVDPKCIADLIRKEVALQRKEDQQKIKSLEAKVRNQNIGKNNTTKNSERGRGGAAGKKKTTYRSPTPPKNRSRSNTRRSAEGKSPGILRNPRSGRGADDRNKDSRGGSKKNDRNRSSSRSGGKSGKSKTKSGRSGGQSGRR